MNTKLTLKLDDAVIERAKTYARDKNTSVSNLVENYLNLITSPKNEEGAVTPLVKSLSGLIDLPVNYDYKKNYKDHLTKKYAK